MVIDEHAQLETFALLVDVLRAAELHVAEVEANLPDEESWQSLRRAVQQWQRMPRRLSPATAEP